ncbi:hypothetical protein DSM110093_01988 [Sulfitobacter sp. DSM 110093]|uniref:hypothetical protein n=1 Tax=Sulfitobacter sp. DSM 110093 TaxID=2883127 RepID=UPI001FABCC3C|nr:hypothetical protein [Sulfitobacter sp. DSM 110093]UOA32203.1 hypothetical protein DSM110093_01988 [Sulfitobacter sp. DSM 110093]
MVTYTLDTNCIIDLEEERRYSQAVKEIISAHQAGTISVSVVAVSASERQPGDRTMANYEEFVERLNAVGLGELEQLNGIMTYGFSFFGKGYYGGTEEMIELDRRIHNTLFPRIDYGLNDFISRQPVRTEEEEKKLHWKWRNAFCDRQMYWAHAHHERDIFVSGDKNFSELRGMDFYPHGRILTPEMAARELG